MADDETYLDFKAGDTASFVFAPTDTGNAVLVKPTLQGSVTNGVIVTDRRFYIVELQETSTRRPHYSVSFSAPKRSRSSGTPSFKPPRGKPRSYAISAKSAGAQIAPTRIWDDGQKTYFEFGGDAPIPSVFRADVEGREHIVNGRARGTVFVVGRRSDRWVLRYGDEYICIENKELRNG